jgi:hypothetical protein
MGIKQLIIKFLWMIILPCSIGCAICEVLLRHIPNDYVSKNEWLAENAGKIKILTLGSSHGYFDINPEYFSEPAFNAGYVSQSINYDFFIFNKFIDQMDNLETLVLPISYFTLFSKLENGSEAFRAKKYRLYCRCNYHPFALKYNFEFDFDMATIRHRIAEFYLGNRDEIFSNELGYGLTCSLDKKPKDWEATGIITAKRHTLKEDSLMTFFCENKKMIDLIIAKCQKRNIQVILLTTPTWHTYYENLDPEQLEIKEKTCNELVHSFDNVTYLNLLYDKRFVADDFYDTDHLSEKGAEKLTRLLDTYIIHEKEINNN